MPHYQSDDEDWSGVNYDGLPHESLNFRLVGDTYYGFVQHNVRGRAKNIIIDNLGAQPRDSTVDGILVVFCAEKPRTNYLLVTGWYRNATVYRSPIERSDPKDPYNRLAYFKAKDATLVPESERCFRIPTARQNPPSSIGGLGYTHIWYGLNEDRAREFRELLYSYIDPHSTLIRQEVSDLTRTPLNAVEWRQRRLSERLERRGNHRHFIDDKGYRCEACNWSISKEEQEVWGSSFELHHLEPVHRRRENELRDITPEDFAVLCASCHRAIHRTKFVSDVAGFADAYIE